MPNMSTRVGEKLYPQGGSWDALRDLEVRITDLEAANLAHAQHDFRAEQRLEGNAKGCGCVADKATGNVTADWCPKCIGTGGSRPSTEIGLVERVWEEIRDAMAGDLPPAPAAIAKVADWLEAYKAENWIEPHGNWAAEALRAQLGEK